MAATGGGELVPRLGKRFLLLEKCDAGTRPLLATDDLRQAHAVVSSRIGSGGLCLNQT